MELLKDPKRHALEDRVEVVIDDEVSRHFPAKRGSRITVRLNDGRVMDKFVYKLKGSPDIPVGWPELYDKFLGSASLCFTSDRQEEITSCVKQIDSRRASELASILSSDISAIHLRASER
jgi:2-methylcitrate dehydratase PrpD